MPERNDAALEFLLTRRSRPAKTLTAPAPSREELLPLLTAAARTPDHGKLEPWRFIVVEKPAMARLRKALEGVAAAPDLRPAFAGLRPGEISWVGCNLTHPFFPDAHSAIRDRRWFSERAVHPKGFAYDVSDTSQCYSRQYLRGGRG